MDKLVWATQLRRDYISVYASKFDRERHHAVSTCTPPPMLVPLETKLPVLKMTVCHCRLDSTDSSSWHSLSALDRHQLSSQLSLQTELAQLSAFSEMTSSQLSLLSCQSLTSNFVTTLTTSRAGSTVSLSGMTSITSVTRSRPGSAVSLLRSCKCYSLGSPA